MRREIKFRGMSISGDWYYGLLSHIKNASKKPDKDGWFISNSTGQPLAYQIRPETISEYTGLKDMYGTDIYEGDILKNVEYGHTMKVRWGIENESYAGWCAEWMDETKNQALMYNATLKNCKVIGNIYENE